MSKAVKFDDDAFDSIKAALDQQVKAVGSTLGPRAHNVLFGRPFGVSGVVHDGVTVSKELDPEDPFEAAVHEIIKNAAAATNDEAGDGTTTATILVHSLFNEGRKLITAGHNAQILRKGVEQATEEVVERLKATATPVKTNKQQLEVAVIASQNDKIGAEVAKAFEKLGNDAVIAVEESKQNYIYSEYKDGMEISQGYISRYFVNNQFKEAVIDNASIIVTDYTLSNVLDIKNISEALSEMEIQNNIVIIAADVNDVALGALLHNVVNLHLKILAVRAPGYGEEQQELLEDIALSVGGRFISKAAGRTLVFGDEGGINKEDIGHAEKVVAVKDSTTIVGGKGDPDKIKERVEMITKEIKKETTSEFEVERLRERKAKLTSGVAIINVGARNESEAKELKERTIDAVGAIKAANEMGIVPGGETALLRASWNIEYPAEGTDEFKAGYKLVAKAMEAPFKVLMHNSGLEPGQMIERVLQTTATWADKETNFNVGVDALDGLVKDLPEAGIIDPIKVPISALQNAVSAAMSLLTSGTIIADIRKDKDSDVV